MPRKLPRKDAVIVGLGWTGSILAHELTDWPDLAESPADYWAERSALAWQ